jgi:hypothetical protein
VSKLPEFENLPELLDKTDAQIIEFLCNLLDSTTATLEQEKPYLSGSMAIVELNQKAIDYNNAVLKLVSQRYLEANA